MFGAGCWAQSTGPSKGVATSVSGTGEDLIKTLLAKEVAVAMSKSDLPSNAVHASIKSSFLGTIFIKFFILFPFIHSSRLRGNFTLFF